MAGQKSAARGFLEESFIVSCHKTTRGIRFPRKKAEQSQDKDKKKQNGANKKKRADMCAVDGIGANRYAPLSRAICVIHAKK